MIVRTYGRRSRGNTTRSCSDLSFDDVSDGYDNSLSQESPQDVYGFTFSSQESSHWEPYGLHSSSQESQQFAILPPRRATDSENRDGHFGNSKKVKNGKRGVEVEPYGFNTSQELQRISIMPSRKSIDSENSDAYFQKSKKVKNGKREVEPYGVSSSQESQQFAILPPRKPLNGAELKNNDGYFGKSKKVKPPKKPKLKGVGPAKAIMAAATATATLMETQEFGEMMEHVDEVNFALDGLRKGQQVRVRRASLLSLLSICGTAQQRRLLRTQGMAKTIVDAVLGLSFDDSSSNLAAATLFYILTNDGQDDHLLDSPSCILFLLKLLKPLASDATKCKAPTLGCKLLALRKDASVSQDNKGVDSTSAAIMLRVQEILISCKEMKSRNENDDDKEKPELSPKWIALLTMEKACLSTISLEESTGTVRKSGGNFKEKLREHGGLDAVFEVAGNCRDIMKKWLEEHSCSVLKSKDNLNSESLVVLLKCLKIMENATFLSQNNQSHLLGMRVNFEYQQSPQSFTDLILSVIEILSGVSLLVHSSGSSNNEDGHTFELPPVADSKGVDYSELLSISSSMRSCSMDVTSSHSSQNLVVDLSRFSQSSSEATTAFAADTNLLKMRAGSSSGTSSSSNSGIDANSNGSWMNFGFGKRSKDTGDTKQLMVDSQDPFAFDEDEFEPSKWDLLSRRKEGSQAQKRRVVVEDHDEDHDDVCQPLVISTQQESSNMEIPRSCEASCLSAIDVEKSNILSDCLLTAVKVLMNLTNDNPIGCQQIAASGGLETLSSLIAVHFPSFSSYSPSVSELRQNILSFNSEVEVAHQNDRHLTDQELDFLVAILGLLVNLVEKDGQNRSRLATTRVSVPSLDRFEDEGRNVISLLCSIFLANQGAGEAAGEGKQSTSDDEDAEDAVLQGEKEAEKMIVEAYSALLLAFISTESKSIRNVIAECLPDHNLSILVPVLERFVEFHLALNMISPETHTTVLEVIESCRVP